MRELPCLVEGREKYLSDLLTKPENTNQITDISSRGVTP